MPLYRCTCGSWLPERLYRPQALGKGRYAVRCGRCRREWVLALPFALDIGLHLVAQVAALLVFVVPLFTLPAPWSVVISVFGSAATFLLIQFGLLLLQPLEERARGD